MIAAYNSVLLGKSQNFSLGHLFTEKYDATKMWPSDKFKDTLRLRYLKVHCYMQLSLKLTVYRCMASSEQQVKAS